MLDIAVALRGAGDRGQLANALRLAASQLRGVAAQDDPTGLPAEASRELGTAHGASVREWVGSAEAAAHLDVAGRLIGAASALLEYGAEPDLEEAASDLARQAAGELARASALAPDIGGEPPNLFADTMAHLTYEQVERAAAARVPVLLPTGVIEEHGPHLPLAVDAYAAHLLCRLVRRRLAERQMETLIAPPFYWGVNVATSGFGGSFKIRPETSEALLRDMISSLHEDGFDSVIIVDHQGDIHHNRMLVRAVEGARRDGLEGVFWASTPYMIERLGMTGQEPHWIVVPNPPGMGAKPDPKRPIGVHAHAPETSMMRRWFPSLVDEEALAGLQPTKATLDDLARWREGGAVARGITPLGFFGDPDPRGVEMWRGYEAQADAIAEGIHARLSARADPDDKALGGEA